MTAAGQSQKVRAQLKHDKEYWRTTLATYAGRAVIWRILELCGEHQDCPSVEPGVMAGFLAKRHVGLRVVSEVYTHDPKAYRLMEDEELERQANAQPNKVEGGDNADSSEH